MGIILFAVLSKHNNNIHFLLVETNYEKTLGIAWLILESFKNNSIVLELEATAKDKNPTCQYQQYWPYTNNSLINAKYNPTRSSSD